MSKSGFSAPLTGLPNAERVPAGGAVLPAELFRQQSYSVSGAPDHDRNLRAPRGAYARWLEPVHIAPQHLITRADGEDR